MKRIISYSTFFLVLTSSLFSNEKMYLNSASLIDLKREDELQAFITDTVPTHQNGFDLFQYKKEVDFVLNDIQYLKDRIGIELTTLASFDSLSHSDTCLTLYLTLKELNKQLLVLTEDAFMFNDSLKHILYINEEKLHTLESNFIELSLLNDTLSIINTKYKQQLTEKAQLLEEKIEVLRQKEQLLYEKEALYKEAINNSTLNKVALEGLINVKEERILSKNIEIEYLQKQIEDKERGMASGQTNLDKVLEERNKYMEISDTLRENLFKIEKEILILQEELKYNKKRVAEAEAKISNALNKKKKVRIIQGIALKFYRTPKWDIKPESMNGAYQNIIINRNAGNLEFDFITGASVMLYDFSKDRNKFTYDLGLYVGFGGSNLFKNFYLGPSFKFLDFFHLCTGINVAEYDLLAGNVKEGDALAPGWQIQTVSQWKINMFFSLSLDLELLTYIGKK